MAQYICTVGIPAFNEENSILNLLSDVFRDISFSTVSWQIIVVANGCNDNTVGCLISYGYQNAKLIGIENIGNEKWLSFQKNQHVFKICQIDEARKTTALNIIHNNSKSDIIILLDADVRLSESALLKMLQTLKNNRHYSVVTPRYEGTIAPFQNKNGPIDYLRILTNQAINQFDSCIPRLDGKAFAYRKDLITHHIHIVPVDTWIEGIAWTESVGCIYLQQPTVHYQFPKSFGELSKQYARYMKSFKYFKTAYPALHKAIMHGRNKTQNKRGCKIFLIDRFIGWIFFQWVEIYNKIFHIQMDLQEATWESIPTTKTNLWKE